MWSERARDPPLSLRGGRAARPLVVSALGRSSQSPLEWQCKAAELGTLYTA